MKRLMSILMALSIAICFSSISVSAGEHGGKEHGGDKHSAKEQDSKEHGGKEHGGAQPAASDIRSTMAAHVAKQSKKTGSFDILDPETGAVRNLKLIRVHERVGKTGDYFYSCADFRDINTGELLDLDLDVEYADGKLSVVDVRIHKVSGKERYTYDNNDNRIPISN